MPCVQHDVDYEYTRRTIYRKLARRTRIVGGGTRTRGPHTGMMITHSVNVRGGPTVGIR